MILQRLCEYYDRIAADQDIEIAQQGFAPQKISFEVVVDSTGALASINDIRHSEGKKVTPQAMELPFESRTSGVKPMFLWDKAEYLLGYVPAEFRNAIDSESEGDRKKREKKLLRIEECFNAFRERHLDLRHSINDPTFQALCAFLVDWQPSMLSAATLEVLDEVGTGFGVVRLEGEQRYLHEVPLVKKYWISQQGSNSESDTQGTCLVTGETSPLARLHPVLKGVRDAQSSGASIVSFNKNAFESFGKSQSFNSPVSEACAFKYTTALNFLLDKSNQRKLQVGDTTCVFWADEPSGVAEDLFGFGLDPGSMEDEERAKEVGNRLKQASEGIGVLPDPGAGFYVLGISPNASRLSVRFWVSSSAIQMIEHVIAHQKRLEIIRSEKDLEWIPLWMILAQTARESKEIPPLMGGALLRCVLSGGPYPLALLAAIVRRIRAEQDIKHVKAAVIKAILNHNYQKEISTMLDTERPECSYHLGRLFACLERAQEDALPGLNATIKDRYFGAASSTPSTVFPQLIRMNQHHVGKLDGGKKVVAEKRIQEIVGRVNVFPSHLGLVDQGLFAIGYYHQRQDFFQRKKPVSDEK